jgi:glucosyl-dolichyl phosphate glucuronosyltransferase
VKHPQVTVAMACHSSGRWESICRALDSISAQINEPSAVIVAVDHNAELAREISRKFNGVTVVRNESGARGASATRNLAAEQAQTPVIAFLDDDEVARPTWLKELLVPFRDPSVVGTGGRYTPAWQSRRPGWFPDEFGWVVGAHYKGMPSRNAEVRNVWSGNMAVRTDAFRQVRGFRTDFGKVGLASSPEDTDFCIRAARATGKRWIYVPTAVIEHEVPPSRATLRFFARRCVSEGRSKVEMARLLGGGDSLDHERAYMRRTVPLGILRNVACGRVDRAAAMAFGIVCAAWGLGAAARHDRRSEVAPVPSPM